MKKGILAVLFMVAVSVCAGAQDAPAQQVTSTVPELGVAEDLSLRLPKFTETVDVVGKEVDPLDKVEGFVEGLGFSTNFTEPTDHNLLELVGLRRQYPLFGNDLESYNTRGRNTFVVGVSPVGGLLVGMDVPVKNFIVTPTLSFPVPGHYGGGLTFGYRLKAGSFELRPILGVEVVHDSSTNSFFSLLKDQQVKKVGLRVSHVLSPQKISQDEGEEVNLPALVQDWKTYVGVYAEVSYRRFDATMSGTGSMFHRQGPSVQFGGFFSTGHVFVRLKRPIAEIVEDLRAERDAELAKPKVHIITCAEQQPLGRASLCNERGWDDGEILHPRLGVSKGLRIVQALNLAAAAFGSFEVSRVVKGQILDHTKANPDLAMGVGLGFGAINTMAGLDRAHEAGRSYQIGQPAWHKYLELVLTTMAFTFEGLKLK